MKKIAIKHLSPENIESARIRAIQLRLSGYSLAETAQQTGLSAPTIIKAFKAFTAGGWASVKSAPRGRKAGMGCGLTLEQQQHLAQRLLQSPDSGLWHREAVVQVIGQDFGVKLSARSVSRLLEQWGLQPPILKLPIPKGVRNPYARWYRQHYQPLQTWAEANEGQLLLAHCQPSRRHSDQHQPERFQLCLQTPLRRQLWLESTHWPTQHWLIDVLTRALHTLEAPVAVCLSGLDLSRADTLQTWLQQHRSSLHLITVPTNADLRSVDTP